MKDTFNRIMNNTSDITNNNEVFMQIVKEKMKKVLCERKQNIRMMVESMVEESEILVDRWMDDIRSQFRKRNKKDNKMNEIPDNVIRLI